ncbi:hypothetical protein [Thaumasiovibrio subtropicus]|uniref:hypothetical protein n=1 Tax=Thaumasiovibrio subtropicus TaxID=1891207 RepID=UPI000B35F571|nr:hypothetical protein [Thaumasiovibrio subtropicus]
MSVSTVRNRISLTLYSLCALALTGAGLRYLFATEIMPYHLDAMALTWQDLSPGMQVMTLNFMKSAGVGMFTSGVTVSLMIVFAIRKGLATYASTMTVAIMLQTGLVGYFAYQVDKLTPANPPFAALFSVAGLAVIAYYSVTR